MRILVCGGRNYADREAVFRALDEVCIDNPDCAVTVIQGGADGADALAREWCNARAIPCLNVPADWKAHGRAAGPLRNQRMLTYKPHLVIAFPGGRGTADMVRRAEIAGIEVRKPT